MSGVVARGVSHGRRRQADSFRLEPKTPDARRDRRSFFADYRQTRGPAAPLKTKAAIIFPQRTGAPARPANSARPYGGHACYCAGAENVAT